MSWWYKNFIRQILFKFDPEDIHNFTINVLGKIGRNEILRDCVGSFFSSPNLRTTVFGLDFRNPVGLAAGMDKDAEAVPVWEMLGFGYIEAGAVTFHPQPGNPKPRLFRVIPDKAIINRMGFNNKGAEAIAKMMAEYKSLGLRPAIPIGVNIGKSKIMPLEEAVNDYEQTFRILYEHFDFFVVNVSSPNTPGLRSLQDKDKLNEILKKLSTTNTELANKKANNNVEASSEVTHQTSQFSAAVKPLLVKIAPDLSFEAIEEILQLSVSNKVQGIVATNTTITRPAEANPELAKIYSEQGGLSGLPLKNKSTEIIKFIYKSTAGKLPIIGVGGIFNADDAWEKICAGASLVQIYTGYIYEGPLLPKNIVTGLIRKLDEYKLKSISDAVGLAHR